MNKGLFRASAYSVWAAMSVSLTNRYFWQSDPVALMLFTLGAFVGELACATPLGSDQKPWRLALYGVAVVGVAICGMSLLLDSLAVYSRL